MISKMHSQQLFGKSTGCGILFLVLIDTNLDSHQKLSFLNFYGCDMVIRKNTIVLQKKRNQTHWSISPYVSIQHVYV